MRALLRRIPRRLLAAVGILLAALVLMMGALVYRHWKSIENPYNFPTLKGEPIIGVWYRVYPEGTVSADGSGWHGMFRLGAENKVVVYFYGGGLALDPVTAASPYSLDPENGYYYDTEAKLRDYQATWGFGNREAYTPFRDWSIVAIPYTTGDIHIGRGEFECTMVNGETRTVRFHGYDNYEAMMDEVRDLVGSPEALLITGTSAGGFGASLLAEDVAGRFPETENVTLCLDSALLRKPDWPETARDFWNAPAEIAGRVTSDNIVLDGLTALHRDLPKVKILYTCSLRDAELARFQAYVDTGEGRRDESAGDIFQESLTGMVADIRREIPEAGFYIWDCVPFSEEEGETLTRHTVLVSSYAREALVGDKVFLDWICDAVEGNVESYGLELVTEEQEHAA